MEPEFWNTKRVARYLGFSMRTIRRKAQTGDLPAFRIFGEWRFRAATIKQLARTGENEHDKNVLYVGAFP